MTDPIKRAQEMLRVASTYIDLHCPGETIEYDETTCDGLCVAEDCGIAADMLATAKGAIDSDRARVAALMAALKQCKENAVGSMLPSSVIHAIVDEALGAANA